MISSQSVVVILSRRIGESSKEGEVDGEDDGEGEVDGEDETDGGDCSFRLLILSQPSDLSS